MSVELCIGSREPSNYSAYDTIFFLHKYLGYDLYKPITIEEKFKCCGPVTN